MTADDIVVLRWTITSSIVDQRGLDRKQSENNFMSQIAIPLSDFADLDAAKNYIGKQYFAHINAVNSVCRKLPDGLQMIGDPYTRADDVSEDPWDVSFLDVVKIGCAEGHTRSHIIIIFNAFITDEEDGELTPGKRNVFDYSWR